MDLQKNTFIRKPEIIFKYMVKVKYIATHTHTHTNMVPPSNTQIKMSIIYS